MNASPLRVPGVFVRRRAVQHGLCRFLHLSDPALRPVAGVRRLPDRDPGRRPFDRRHVPVDPHRRFDGPVRHPQSHPVFCLDGDGFGAPVSVSAVVLGPASPATDQRRRRFVRLVWRADPDCPACRGRCPISRQVHFLRPAWLDDGADPRWRRLGFRRCMASLSRRHRVGRGADHRAAARSRRRSSSRRHDRRGRVERGSAPAMPGLESRITSTRSC